MKRLTVFIIAVLALCGCHKNDPELFSDKFVAFTTSGSSSTVINENGSVKASYYVHYTGTMPEAAFTVTIQATPGDGLVEGRDYNLASSSTLTFTPGVFDRAFNIEWLPNTLDASKNNTLTLTITSVSDPSVAIGMTGPSRRMSTLTLSKTK